MRPDYLLHASSLSSCLEQEQCQLGLHEYQIQAANFQGKKAYHRTKKIDNLITKMTVR